MLALLKTGMNDGYDMMDLLALTVSESAERMSLHSGQPPVLHVRGVDYIIEGPAITTENADALLRSLAGTRHLRSIRNCELPTFIYTFRNSAQFQVQAKLQDDAVQIELRRLAI